MAEEAQVRRAFLYVGLAALAAALVWLLARAGTVFLVAFAGVLLGVLLDGLARGLVRWARLPRPVALALVMVALPAAFAGLGFLVGPSVGDQFVALGEQLPTSAAAVRDYLGGRSWGRWVLHAVPPPEQFLPQGASDLAGVTGAFSSAFGALANLAIIVFVGVYTAVSPDAYVRNALKLVPLRHRARGREVAAALGFVLRRWLAARFASMAVVGVLTGIGLGLLGVPLALSLAVISALFSFVPYIGPVVSVVPAMLVALTQGPQLVGWVALLYLGVQTVESYLVTPMIEQRAVSLPPAALIVFQVLMGVLAGALGVLLATPLAVLVTVIVQLLYVEDVLGDEVTVLGR